MHRWLVVCIILAGCTDVSVDPLTITAAEAATIGWKPVAIPGASNLTETSSLTGSFDLYDSRRIPEQPGDPQQVHDLAALVPEGLLFTLTAEVTAETSGDIDVGVSNGSGEGYETTCDCPLGGYNLYSYTGVMGDKLDFIIQYDETGQEASFDYTIDLTVTGYSAALPVGAPMGITLAVGEAVRFDTNGNVAVWDPADTRVADLQGGTYTAMTAGEHVIMGTAPGADFTIETNATDPQPRMLRTDEFRSETWTTPSDFSTNFTTPGNIIAVGACLFVDEFAQDPSIRLTGPAGVVFEESDTGAFFAGEWGVCYESDTGDSAITAGEYQLEADRERGVGGEVYYTALFIGR